MKIYDLSKRIDKRDPIYPGNPRVVLKRIKKFSRRNPSNLSGIALGLHTASHLDAPLHYLKNGRSVDRVLLEKCIGWCKVLDLTKNKKEITEKDLKPAKLRRGEILLLKTRNSRTTGRFDKNFVHITDGAAKFLVKLRIKAVGIDG